MSHPWQIDFVKEVKEKYPSNFANVRVLEVGSYNVNGTVRDLFSNCDYVGIDVAAGPCVDVVCSGDEYTSEALFDTVISCEMLEHNPKWKKTLQNMHRLLKPGGLLVVTCATTGRPEHGTKRTTPSDAPSSDMFGDYYMNITKENMLEAVPYTEQYYPSEFSNYILDLRFFGVKNNTSITSSRIDGYTKGWLVGDFHPAIITSKDIEVGVKYYSAGSREDRHVHNLVVEHTVVLSGKVRMNNIEYGTKDIVTILPGVSTDFQCLEDAITLVIKTPSLPKDKHPA